MGTDLILNVYKDITRFNDFSWEPEEHIHLCCKHPRRNWKSILKVADIVFKISNNTCHHPGLNHSTYESHIAMVNLRTFQVI